VKDTSGWALEGKAFASLGDVFDCRRKLHRNFHPEGLAIEIEGYVGLIYVKEKLLLKLVPQLGNQVIHLMRHSAEIPVFGILRSLKHV
jgi:hypothetical protein